jgi:VWFA-related protein
MRSRSIGRGLATLLRSALVAFAAGCVFAVWGQLPPPGRESQAPPPQPGQLGPAQKQLPPSEPAPNEPNTENQATSLADTGDYRLGVTVRYVLVPTTVLDPDGHGYVNGLGVKDFEVLDNDKPQKINSDFTQQPLSVVLVVQANSEIAPLLPTIKKSGLLLQGLVTGQEGDAAILAFDHRMQVMQDFTDDAGKLDDAMHKITSGSSTAALVDAVMKADEMLRRHDQQNKRRRVIILMSRNIDKGSEAKLQESVRRMQFDNVIVYSVDISRVKTALLKKPDFPGRQNGGVPPEALPDMRGTPHSETTVIQQENGNALNGVPTVYRGIRDLFKKTPAEAFASFTGGNVYSFSNQRGLEDAITDIGKDLNSQYLLSYSPNDTKEPGFHHIQVTVDRPGLKVRTRPGYWWGGGQP